MEFRTKREAKAKIRELEDRAQRSELVAFNPKGQNAKDAKRYRAEAARIRDLLSSLPA
jgi:ribosomal protein L22